MPVCVFAEDQGCSQGQSIKEDAYAPGEVIVSFSDDVTKKESEAIIEDAAEETDASVQSEDIQITDIDKDSVLVETDQQADTVDMVEELQDNPNVEAVQPNYYYTVDSAYSNPDPKSNGKWYMDYMDVPEAWAAIAQYQQDGTIKDKNGASIDYNELKTNPDHRVKIATLDSGIYISHEDLDDYNQGGNFDVEHCKSTVAGISPEETPDDPRSTAVNAYPNPNISHGHNVSSVIGATSNNGIGIAGIAAGYDVSAK